MCSHAFASTAPACIRTQLHLAHPCTRCTPALKGFVCAAVLRSLGHGNRPHSQPVALMARQQPASAAGCFHAASLPSQAAAFRSEHSAALRLEGLRLRSIAFTQPTHQPALDRSGTLRFAVLLRTLSVGLQAAARCTQLVQPPAATFRCSPQAPKSLHPLDIAAAKKKSCSSVERVQAKRRLRTAATLTLWASVQPGAFFFCSASLGVSDWRLALLIWTFGVNSVGMANAQSTQR